MEENWVQFNDTLYFVSNYGRVKSCYFNREKILKFHTNHKGYFMVGIGPKNYFVHRLVAMCFIPKVEGKEFVNHINGVKTDNNASNLEWCTVHENNAHAALNGLGTPMKQCVVINMDNQVLGEYDSEAAAKRVHGYKKSTIIIAKIDFNDAYREQMIADRNKPRKKFVVSNRTLNTEQVQFIRKMIDSNEYNFAYIGRLFNVDPSVIHGIHKNKLYRDVPIFNQIIAPRY